LGVYTPIYPLVATPPVYCPASLILSIYAEETTVNMNYIIANRFASNWRLNVAVMKHLYATMRRPTKNFLLPLVVNKDVQMYKERSAA